MVRTVRTARSTAVPFCATLALALALAGAPGSADAFCGFYINGAGAKLFNNATLVVLMRDGTRTVLAMQNSYEGPPEDFAMVVPVPVILKEENVKTLSKEVFDRVDSLAAPRLVEYWEIDPCAPEEIWDAPMAGPSGALRAKGGADGAEGLGVKIEASFAVGEYKILILSASDATGLETWLKREGYKIPDGAEPILRPYVASGSKFFVAKVDVKKVKFEGGRAMLSPLRVHYDTPDFNLPIRLGLVNSGGTQDLIVHILARGKRYEAANYKNVTIPTDLDVSDATRTDFGAFYAALFDETLRTHPGSVVTEYSWDANSCDPCPTPALTPSELLTLGADVLPGGKDGLYGFVLTRLHARYSKDSLGEDLIFREAPPIAGGREWLVDGAKLEKGSRSAPVNNFQGRYAIRHPWTGAIACKDPHRGRWGGPPAGVKAPDGAGAPKAARDLAFAKRGVALASFVREAVPEIGLAAPSGSGAAPAGGSTTGGSAAPADDSDREDAKSCAIHAPRNAGAAAGGFAVLVGAVLAVVAATRRRYE